MSARQLTLMAVHAHPDDEVTGTGGVLAKYAAQGVRTVVVTCTDGRCGDGPGGVKPGEPGHDPDAVALLRRSELEASCKILNVTHLELLDYHDSGMMGWATNQTPGSFWTVPVEQAAGRLAALMRKYQPDVVITYDENGFYGHPDHIQVNRVTMAAIAQIRTPAKALQAKVYWGTFPRSRMVEFERILRELGAEWDEPESATEQPEIGLPDDQISTWVDATAFGTQKFEALAAHASQSENIVFLKMGAALFTTMMGVETFVRVGESVTAVVREDDLFAGLT